MKRSVFLGALVVAMTLTAADLPYAGKWKVNLAKSDFGGTTMAIESLPGGEWQVTGFGITYKFKMDGHDYPDGMGGMVAWKAVDANTWQMVAKANGKVTETDNFKLSSDGKTLTDTAKQMKADGGSLESTDRLRSCLRGAVNRRQMEDEEGLRRVRDDGDGRFREQRPDLQRS